MKTEGQLLDTLFVLQVAILHILSKECSVFKLHVELQAERCLREILASCEL